MMTDQSIIDMILRHEGGRYTNDPLDRGGPTRYGITMPVLALYYGRPVSVSEIQNLSMATASAVYRALFVAPFARLPDPLRLNVIDMGVNAGQRRAVLLLQQTIGADVDGALGPQTLRLTTSRVDWSLLYTGVRLAFYEGLVVANPSQVRFRNGWRNRALSFADVDKMQRVLTTRRREALRWNTAPTFSRVGKAYMEAE